MLNPKKAIEVLEQHFQAVTQEKFINNLHQYCPEIVESESENSVDGDYRDKPNQTQERTEESVLID